MPVQYFVFPKELLISCAKYGVILTRLCVNTFIHQDLFILFTQHFSLGVDATETTNGKSDSLNINQMDVFFVDLCSFMSVNETLYSRKKRIAIRYRRNQNRATVEGLLLVISSLKINGREEHPRAV